MALEEKVLEENLLKIGRLNYISKQIDSSKSPGEHYLLYDALVKELFDGTQKDYDNIYGDIRVSPEEAMNYTLNGMKKLSKDIAERYMQNKNKIVDEVVSSMNATIKDLKNKAEAAQRLVPYFTNLIKTKELSQNELDYKARKEIASRVGVSMNYTATIQGMDEYRDLQQRVYAGIFVKEDKDGKLSIDRARLGEAMEEIAYGASLYTNTKAIEEAKKKAS